MLVNFAKTQYILGAGSTISGKLKQTRQIAVKQGRVWLTVEGQNTDFWLQAGEVVQVPAHRLLVIEAQQEASEIAICFSALNSSADSQWMAKAVAPAALAA
ncbi:MAG: DUF2917 domain-containing protein [Burkholderiales bacterium]|nr:DUF2917 domain-containing protein [Burkholderiales bacterium]